MATVLFSCQYLGLIKCLGKMVEFVAARSPVFCRVTD